MVSYNLVTVWLSSFLLNIHSILGVFIYMEIFIKWASIGLALFFLCLGLVGFFIPLLPSTPFILLAAFFSVRGSKRLNSYIKGSKFYQTDGVLLIEKKQMTLKTKVSILSFASIMLLVSMLWVDSLLFKFFIVLLIIIKYTYFFVFIETVKEVNFDD